jgi:dihydrofolate synthase/folylpolyglutamate synthase
MNLQNWLEYQQNTHHKTIDLGLERISKVYNKLFPRGVDFKVITIAGTNGKGSTGNFLANIFKSAKINYGWFSSPHIEKYNERFVINGVQATDSEIITAFEKIEEIRDDISLSYFEYSTLAAILIFQAQKIEVAILEIGLGGRLDSVNVVPNDVSIITSIALDHTDFLGDTIEKIAFEKAGIIKENTKTFTCSKFTKNY